MSRKANPTLIGTFVLVGFALGIGAVLLVTSSRLFTHTREYILYFDASLTGLDRGAPVKFRGVTVGAVKDVLIHSNQEPLDRSLPVIIEINAEHTRKRSDASFDLLDPAQVEAHICHGLRGKIETQSLLTGLLFVELDFLPGTPAIYHQIKKTYTEIPSAPVDVQLFRIDFAEITQRLSKTLATLDATLGELRMRDINREVTNLLVSLNRVASSSEITNALTSARLTLDEVRQLSAGLRMKSDSLAASAEGALDESRKTVAELRQGIQEVRDIVAPEAPLRQDLEEALNDLSQAARSVSELAEFLNRHPNALISGRKPPEGQR